MKVTPLFDFLDQWEEPTAKKWQAYLIMCFWTVVLVAFAAEMLILCYIFN